MRPLADESSLAPLPHSLMKNYIIRHMNRLKRISRLALLLSPLGLLGCLNDSEPRRDLIPLTSGNYWAFINPKNGDSARVQVDSQFTVHSQGKTYRAGLMTFLSGDTNIYANGEEGLYLLTKSRFNGSLEATFLLKYPASTGDAWTVLGQVSQTSLYALDKVLQTPAGNFKCHVYRQPSSEAVIYDYIVPGMGQVGELMKGVTSDGTETSDTIALFLLKAYRVH